MRFDINSLIVILEYIGTVSFAVSGAFKAISKHMDILGITIAAVITAIGGGFIRDTVIGIFPQTIFIHPKSTFIAACSGIFVFIIVYFFLRTDRNIFNISKIIIYITDTAGLAAFTVIGAEAGISSGYESNIFLIVFLGSITGVGGGILCDIILQEIPQVFIKHIYVCASIAGATLFALTYQIFSIQTAITASLFTTSSIRMVAIIFKLNLPTIKTKRL